MAHCGFESPVVQGIPSAKTLRRFGSDVPDGNMGLTAQTFPPGNFDEFPKNQNLPLFNHDRFPGFLRRSIVME